MTDYIRSLKENFEKNANPENAKPMAKYMKNLFPFLGIKTPQRKELFKDFMKENGLPRLSELKEITLELWNLPEREYQYVAIGLLRKFAKKWDADFIDLLEKIITEKSWWDSVDGIASWLVGSHFKRFPEKRKYVAAKNLPFIPTSL